MVVYHEGKLRTTMLASPLPQSLHLPLAPDIVYTVSSLPK